MTLITNIKHLGTTCVLCILLAAGCISCSKLTPKEAAPEVISVKVLTIDSIHQEGIIRNYVGSVEESFSTRLSFGTGGYIKNNYVSEGKMVKKGQLLLSLDKRNAESAYKAAKATLTQAQDGYKRLKQVYDQGSIAEVKWIEMQTNLAQAESMEQIALKSLNDCDMYAPFAGVVGEISAESGMNLLPMQPVLKLMDIDKVHISFSVPENEISVISIGQKARVEISALNNAQYSGKIIERGVVADPLSHSYTVKVELGNAQHELLPGMVGKVFIENGADAQGFVVPSNAIQTGLNGSYVWIDDNGKATRRQVKTDGFVRNGVLITDGLKQGDKIITEGYLKICEGISIKSE